MEEKRQIYADWRLYRRAFCWVIENLPDGTTRLARFHPRKWQEEYESTRTNNDVALKARKVGFSTDVLTELYAKAETIKHFKGAILSHEEDATKRLLDILKTCHEYNPLAQETPQNNTEGMGFKYTKSKIWIGTAGARVFGRGDNLNMVHLSEPAHYYKKVADTKNFMAGVLEAVAKGGRIVLESTPNGEDPIFYQTWLATRNGELWHGVFLAFFIDETTDWDKDHPLALRSTKRDEFPLTAYEQSIMQAHNVSLGHIRFLRYEKAKLNDRSALDPENAGIIGDEKLLLQEYPVDDLSCFLTSDDSVFDQNVVHLYRQRVRRPLFIRQNGALKIWEKPLQSRGYCIGVDTSEGMPTSTWQAAAILDVEKLKYVATLRIKTDLAHLARLLYELGVEYNTALLMVERNNHGHELLARLDTAGYPELYHHQEGTAFLRPGEKKLGWPTRWQDTKPRMIGTFKELFEAGAVELHDEDALREIATYRHYDPRAKQREGSYARGDIYHAPSGSTDDLLMAMMIALQGRDQVSSGERVPAIRYGEW